MDNNTTTDEIELAFRDWWQESYKRPPNAQAVMTHVAFAKHVLQLIELLEAVSEY
ncbi:MAG: hypothetical protein MUP90_15460 [Gammaproteobacteria bacterium]|jgi:hypothetical protein|nr:hypothetical protein [Gammaproteobacteria bacterium]